VIFEGREFRFILGSDVQNDGMYLELNEIVAERWEAVADVFYSDPDGSMSTTVYATTSRAVRWRGWRRKPPGGYHSTRTRSNVRCS
jgi:hypothetical protein